MYLGYTDNAHYVIIVGINEDGSYIMMDPANKARTLLIPTDTKNSWNDWKKTGKTLVTEVYQYRKV